MELFLAGTVSGVGWATPGEKNTWPKALILVKPTCAGWLSQDGHSGPHATWAPLSVFKLHFNGKKMGKAQPLYSSQTSPSQMKEKPVWPSGNRRCQRTSGPFPISSTKSYYNTWLKCEFKEHLPEGKQSDPQTLQVQAFLQDLYKHQHLNHFLGKS